MAKGLRYRGIGEVAGAVIAAEARVFDVAEAVDEGKLLRRVTVDRAPHATRRCHHSVGGTTIRDRAERASVDGDECRGFAGDGSLRLLPMGSHISYHYTVVCLTNSVTSWKCCYGDECKGFAGDVSLRLLHKISHNSHNCEQH